MASEEMQRERRYTGVYAWYMTLGWELGHDLLGYWDERIGRGNNNRKDLDGEIDDGREG